METRQSKNIFKNSQWAGKLYILLGLTFVFSVFLRKVFLENYEVVSKFIEKISVFEALILLLGCILIFEGIYFYSKPEIYYYNFIEVLLLLLPYVVILTVLWIMYSDVKVNMEPNKNEIFICIALFVFSFLFELNKFFVSIAKILEKKVTESKDRLAIVLTIIGTVISAIAIFK